MARQRRHVYGVVAAGVAVVVSVTAAVLVLRDRSDAPAVRGATSARQLGGLESDVPRGWHPSPPDGSAFNLWTDARYASDQDGCDQESDRVFISLGVDPLLPNQIAQDPVVLPQNVGRSTAPVRTREEWMDCDMRFQTFDVELAGQLYRVSLAYGRQADSNRLEEAYAIVERLRPV